MDLLKLENQNQELLHLNLKFLKICGLLISEYKIINIINKSSICFLTLLFVILLINFILLSGVNFDNETKNLNALLTNMKFTFLTLVNLFKYFTFVFRRNEWYELLDYVNEANIEEKVQNDLERSNITRDYTKYARVLTCVYGVFIFITSTSVASTSILKYICTPTYIDGVRQFEQVVDVWAPFNINVFPWCWIIFYGNVLLGYKKAFSWLLLIPSRGNAKLLNSLISPVMFVYVLVCSLFLCTSAFQLFTDMSRAEKIINFIFLSSAIIQLYVYCLHGNAVYNQSLEVSYGPYCCDWWSLDVSRRRMVLLLSGKLRKTVVFTAGPFTDLKFSTFIGIIKGAYSYYTLLRD